jgi:hypothetical protein
MRRAHIQAIFLGFLLVSCASGPANAGTQSGDPAFIVITENPDDQVDVQYENGIALIDIQSPAGIGSATFELESGIMPGEMILQLHLKGLEQFQLTSSQESIRASVPSGGVFNVDDQTIVSAGTESPLLPGNPLWMEIDIVSSQGEKKVPLEEGYFEITVPQEFIQNAGKTFEIEWVDFYR